MQEFLLHLTAERFLSSLGLKRLESRKWGRISELTGLYRVIYNEYFVILRILDQREGRRFQ